MNILITGAFGFVGTNLSQILKTPLNHPVIAIDLANPGNSAYDKFYSWDELDKVDWN